jgi:hypothetical protein
MFRALARRLSSYVLQHFDVDSVSPARKAEGRAAFLEFHSSITNNTFHFSTTPVSEFNQTERRLN